MKKNGPWTIESSEVKYKNPWIEVVEDKVIRPDGKPGIFGSVHIVHGVSVLALDEESNVYLTKEFKYGLKDYSIEVVSGGIDTNEPPEEAAKRELAEELGIVAGEWKSFGWVNPFTSIVHSPQELFLARKLQFQTAHREGTEQIDLVKIPLKDALEMVGRGEITHAPSGMLILKVARYLGL